MSNSLRTVALLPMKAHSERIPGKNFKEFAGRPLFQWVLETLLGIPEIERIIINTDGREVLASHGLEPNDRVLVRDRPTEICGDEVSMNRIIENDMSAVPADTYVMTHTTNPLISEKTIRDAIQFFREGVQNGANDSVFTVSRLQSRFYDSDGKALNHDPDRLLRTQDLPPIFEENSNLYVFSKESFQSTNARIGKTPKMLETPFLESFDIDDADGWHLAELVASSKQSGFTA
ncbi:MAG: acylneuraminate cytidylyltransferase family protein [Planctomycetota bacterium]